MVRCRGHSVGGRLRPGNLILGGRHPALSRPFMLKRGGRRILEWTRRWRKTDSNSWSLSRMPLSQRAEGRSGRSQNSWGTGGSIPSSSGGESARNPAAAAKAATRESGRPRWREKEKIEEGATV